LCKFLTKHSSLFLASGTALLQYRCGFYITLSSWYLPCSHRSYQRGHHSNLIALALFVLTLSHDPTLASF
jgi:hypothetical protein